MNAVTKTQTPILDLVEAFMYEHRGQGLMEQGDVCKAFPGEPAQVIRLSLAALRKQGILGHHLENGKVSYIHHGRRAGEDPPAARKSEAPRFASVHPTLPPSAAIRDRVLKAMEDAKEPRYKIPDLVKLTGLSRDAVNRELDALIARGKVWGHGRTSGRYYTLEPEPAPAEPRHGPNYVPPEPEPGRESAANEPQHFTVGGAAIVETRSGAPAADPPPSTDDELRAIGVPESLIRKPQQRHQPSYGYFNDGSLYMDTRYCQGYLEREDLKKLRDFLNEMFLPTGD